MALKKQLIIPLMTLPLTVAPVAIIAACSNSEANVETVDLEQIVNQATFSVDPTLKNKFADEIKLSDLQWDQAQANPNVSVSFDLLQANKELGTISFNAIFKDPNGKTKPKVANQISGFKTDQPVDNQALIDQEIKRLNQLNQAKQLVKQDQVSQNDLIKWSQSPQTFLNFLNFEKHPDLIYSVATFSFNKNQIEFTMVVSDGKLSTDTTLNATVNLDENIPIQPPTVGNLSIIEAREQARLNYQWQLLSNRVSTQTLDQWQKQPNLVLKALKNFVYQQYFQYHISDFDLKRDDAKHQATLSFKLKARFWRQSQPKVLTSKQALTFQVETFDEKNQADQDIKPPLNPTHQKWKISPINDVVEIDFSQNSQYDANQLYINKGGKIDIDPFAFKNFLLQLIEDKKLINVDGQLPDDWDWNKYIDFGIYELKNLPTQENVTIFIKYYDSANLEDELMFNLELKAMQLDQAQIPVYDANLGFEQFKQYFNEKIKPNVKLNLAAIVNNQGDSVNQFAMLNAKNFLNYTNQDWSRIVNLANNNIRIQTENVQINYLTNEIKFKWVLDGAGEFANHRWVDDQVSTLKLQTNQQIDQSGFSFETNAYQVELNNFHQFNLNNQRLDRQQVQEKLAQFSQNWTWMARELVTFSWFTLAQAFGNQFDRIAVAIIDHQNRPLDFNNLNRKYDDYRVVAKARLKFTSGKQETFIPFVQAFGAALGLQSTTYQSGDEVTITINLKNLLDRPDPVQDANEILPGMTQGNTLGINGLGYEQVIQKWPPRFDIWQAQIGSYEFQFAHNQKVIATQSNNHRFISFNLMALYDFQDQFWPEPDREDGKWVSGAFWSN